MRVVALAADDLDMDRAFPAVLRRFDRHLDVLGRSDGTRRKYRYELLCWWTDYLFPAGFELEDVSARHVEEYLAEIGRASCRERV